MDETGPRAVRADDPPRPNLFLRDTGSWSRRAPDPVEESVR